jgi:hydrogenase maturation protein HypF
LCGLAQTSPSHIAADLHPDYAAGAGPGTTHAWAGLPRLAVQHHHAHLAAVMAEHGLDGSEQVLGFAFDGTGDDGSLWGGEFFLTRRERCERIAALREIPLPGAERAMREPRRVALGVLHEMGWRGPAANALLHGAWPAHELSVLERLLEHQVCSPRTSGMGRLFDAVAALLDLCALATFEGQAAMALQFAAEVFDDEALPLPFALRRDTRPWRIDWAPCVRELVARRRAGAGVTELARAFHLMLAAVVTEISDAHPTVPVVLAGGCFQNRLLLETTVNALRRRGRPVWWAQALPPNDGALALGQVTVAWARWRAQAASCA